MFGGIYFGMTYFSGFPEYLTYSPTPETGYSFGIYEMGDVVVQ